MRLGGIYVDVKAKTDKYKRDLAKAKTMTGKAVVVIQHKISSISFAKVAVAAAAFGAVMTKVALDGFRAVETMKLSTASLAATITSFAKDADKDLAGTYQQAHEYSGQLVLRMEELNAKTVATGVNLSAMVETMAQGGVLLDLNNKEQEKGFLAIANALALMTQGQNQDIQFRQEIRGLMSGEIRATNLLSRLLNERVGGELKKHVALWKEQGTLIESAGALLGGFQEGAKDLENTWTAVGTTLKTMYDKTLRGLFTPFYEDIIRMGKEITLNVLDQNSALNQTSEILKTVVYKGWLDIKNLTKSVLDIILAFKDPLLLIGGVIGMILDGWGQILAILPAITNSFKLITQAVFDSVKMIGHFGAALWKAMSLDFKGAAESITMAKEDWISSGKKSGEAFGSGFFTGIEKNLLEYNKNLESPVSKAVSAPELKKKSVDKDAEYIFSAEIEAYAKLKNFQHNALTDMWRFKAEGMKAANEKAEDMMAEDYEAFKIYTDTKITYIKNGYEEMLLAASELAQSIDSAFEGSMKGLVKGMADGAKSIKDVAIDLLSNLSDAFLDYAMSIAKSQLIASQGGDSSSSWGSLLSGLFSSNSSGVSSGMTVTGSVLSGPMADGGTAQANKSYLVGEKGIEVFTPGTTGTVTPNHEISAGNGVTENNYNINIHTTDPKSFQEYMRSNPDAIISTLQDQANKGNSGLKSAIQKAGR